MKNINDIISQFPEVGEVTEIKALTSGLINQTYLVKTTSANPNDYILQRINHTIFTDIEMLQHTIEVVTSHIRKKLEAKGEQDIERKVLRFVKSSTGKTYYFDGEGYWRVSVYIPRSQTLEAVTPESSYLAGVNFGEFQAMLADVPEEIGEIIPKFHNMEFRLQQLREAVAANPSGRLEKVQDIVDAIE
ncbi:MAG: phosphotransferase, partial [Phocaeicola sp.]|nr:phosphotransferase [Phocaeicola sp.]